MTTEIPVASFAYTNIFGASPLTATFTDTSTGNHTKWIWNFGDGSTSEEQNPTHVYESSGLFSVGLYVENGAGNDIEIVISRATVFSNEAISYDVGRSTQ